MNKLAILPQKDSLAQARNVLTKEAQAISTMAKTLDETFQQAVELLANIKGRVIVSGIGKSGHIAAKLAATFASTGTPSFFVHPGEASHGDLGMITAEDAVIALSHSGESKELSDLIAYCSRYNVPLIAMTGKKSSTLAKAATVILLNGVTEEACPLNLAPTSSTTATLAMGDALAVALMQYKGFEKEDFSRYHPGGKLGAQLLKVGDLMATGGDLPLLGPETTMDQVIITLTDKNLGCAGFIEDGKLAGIITDGDLKRHMTPDLLGKHASEIMTRSPITVAADAFATTAVNMMQDKKITVLFVVDQNNVPQGLLHMHHCLQAGVL